jgi:hypothetical protein
MENSYMSGILEFVWAVGRAMFGTEAFWDNAVASPAIAAACANTVEDTIGVTRHDEPIIHFCDALGRMTCGATDEEQFCCTEEFAVTVLLDCWDTEGLNGVDVGAVDWLEIAAGIAVGVIVGVTVGGIAVVAVRVTVVVTVVVPVRVTVVVTVVVVVGVTVVVVVGVAVGVVIGVVLDVSEGVTVLFITAFFVAFVVSFRLLEVFESCK